MNGQAPCKYIFKRDGVSFEKHIQKVVSLLAAFLITVNCLSVPTVAFASSGDMFFDADSAMKTVVAWLGGATWFENIYGSDGADNSSNYMSSKPQKYYTTPTKSVEDKYGNVTNYYRGGDTTTTNIIDSYNKTFNTIYNTTNTSTSTTNNYKANVQLENFLNSYTTNNNNYTYSANFKSWYYDNTSNTYNYDASETYYNTNNRQYYISIDNSMDEYYLINVQYSPTFVTVNYNYNNTNNTTNNVGDVTNVYYYELTDGCNSSALTADEVAGLDLAYDVSNYELVTDDPNTLSLQHFDEDYGDSSSFNRTFYSENRSTRYVDSGSFGKAVALPSGSAAGVTIPNLSSYDSLAFDFRIYYDDISKLGIYFGDTNIFQRIPSYKSQSVYDYYSDNGNSVDLGRFCIYYSAHGNCPGGEPPSKDDFLDLTEYGYT